MRSVQSWVWIAALSIGGTAWVLNLASWFVQFDPWGIASWAIPNCFCSKSVAMLLRYWGEACLFGAVLLISSGLLYESIEEDSEPKKANSPS